VAGLIAERKFAYEYARSIDGSDFRDQLTLEVPAIYVTIGSQRAVRHLLLLRSLGRVRGLFELAVVAAVDDGALLQQRTAALANL
jgi:hypothetical protein